MVSFNGTDRRSIHKIWTMLRHDGRDHLGLWPYVSSSMVSFNGTDRRSMHKTWTALRHDGRNHLGTPPMARFNGTDRRLDRMCACTVMIMEAFQGLEHKYHYEIVGHSGEGGRRRDWHSAAPCSPFSRCFNRDVEGGVSKMTVLPTAPGEGPKIAFVGQVWIINALAMHWQCTGNVFLRPSTAVPCLSSTCHCLSATVAFVGQGAKGADAGSGDGMPRGRQERLAVVQEMYNHASFCASGDHTLAASIAAVADVAAEPADGERTMVHAPNLDCAPARRP